MNTTSEATADVTPGLTIEQAMAHVAELDFTMLKNKLALKKEWSAELIDEAEQLYRQFLALRMVYPKRKISPTTTIDEFWHAHILDTRAYMADCKALFGRYLHHYPYSGMNDMFDLMLSQMVHAEMRELFLQHFGVDPYARPQPAIE